MEVLDQLQSRIATDPEFFLRDILGTNPWEKQIEIARSVRDHRYTTVRSGNGCGKTYILPRIALWFLHAFAPAVVINTAPTWRQVENQYWRNFREAYFASTVPLGGQLFKTKWEMDEHWFALGIATDEHSVVKFQGWHAPNILVIFDEASGIGPSIWEAALGAMSGGAMVRFVAIGNPNQNTGDFHDTFSNPLYNPIQISAYDVPNVKERKMLIPGLVSWEWVEEMRLRYGEHSDIFRVRVLRQPPLHASDVLISIDAIERAFVCDREAQAESDHVIGLDVARYGEDCSAFVERQGNRAKVLEVIYGNNTMELAGKAARYLRQHKTARMHIDVVGVGTGVFDRLREQPDIEGRVFGVNNAASPRDTENFINVRIEAWSNVRDWLRDANLEKHEGFYQLAHPKYKINSNGKSSLRARRT